MPKMGAVQAVKATSRLGLVFGMGITPIRWMGIQVETMAGGTEPEASTVPVAAAVAAAVMTEATHRQVVQPLMPVMGVQEQALGMPR